MKKTLGSRLLGGATAAFLAVTTTLGSFTAGTLFSSAAGADDEGGAASSPAVEYGNVFSFDGASLASLDVDDLRARIEFKNEDGDPESAGAIGNKYFLLVHAEAVKSDDKTDKKDDYVLKSVAVYGGDNWESALDFEFEGFNAGEYELQSLEGTLLHTEKDWLSEEKAINGEDCISVNEINGYEIVAPAKVQGNTVLIDAVMGHQKVDVQFFQDDGTSPETYFEGGDVHYYVLGRIYKKGGVIQSPDTIPSGTVPDGWAIKEIYPGGTDADCIVGFTKFNPIGEDGKGTVIADDKDKLTLTSDYVFTSRVFSTIDSGALTTYAELMDTTKAKDHIDGFAPMPNGNYIDENNVNIVKFKRSNTAYGLKFESDKPVTISEDDNVYAVVKVEHKTANDTYFIQQLTTDNITDPVYAQTFEYFGNRWCDASGNTDTVKNERFYGNETVTVKLVKYVPTDVLDPANIRKAIIVGSNIGLIANGDILNGFTVEYDDSECKAVEEKDGIIDGISGSIYTNTIKFKAVTAVNEYDFKDILGNRLQQGFIADRYFTEGHTETNLAINYYAGRGINVDADLSGSFGGHTYIANFAKFNGTAVDQVLPVGDPDGKLVIGDHNNGLQLVVHVDDFDRLSANSKSRDFVGVMVESPEDIKTTVDSFITDMQATSAELAAKTPNYKPVVVKGKLDEPNDIGVAYIDTTGYPYDATIYIDGDAIVPQIGTGSGLNMRINKGQTVVFNFTKSKDVTFAEYHISLVDKEGNEEYGPLPEDFNEKDLKTFPNSVPESFVNSRVKGSKNEWLDEVTRHVVFNLVSAEKVGLNSTAGIFLIANPDSVSAISGSTTGWFHSAGYVHNPSGQWHFVYSGMDETLTRLQLSKKDITGENEIENALITIIDKATEKAVAEWVSDGSTKTISLPKGEYVLTETGGNFEYNNVVYKVTNSEVDFTIDENGKITYTGAESSFLSAADAATATDGYIVAEKTTIKVPEWVSERATDGKLVWKQKEVERESVKFTVCDAEYDGNAPAVSNIKISKRAITGQEELEGAVLVLTALDKDANLTGVTVSNNSGKAAEKTKTTITFTTGTDLTEIRNLPDGKYSLEETASPSGMYTVITTFEFEVKEGKVLVDSTLSEAKADADDASLLVVLDGLAKTDVSISKVDAYEGSELEGAKLIIKAESDDIVFDKNNIKVEQGKGAVYDENKDLTSKQLTFISGSEPTLIKGLPNGRFSLTEDTAPLGYHKGTETVYFTIKDGTVSGVSNAESGGDIVSGDDFEESTDKYGNPLLRMKNKPNTLTISKVGILNAGGQETGNAEIEGAQLEIQYLGIEENALSGVTTDSETVINISGNKLSFISGTAPTNLYALPAGDYTLAEITAPSGYAIAETIKFTIGEDGSISNVTKSANDVVEDNGGVYGGPKIIMADKLIQVSFSKQDINGTELKDAELEILASDKKTVASDAYGKELTWVSTGTPKTFVLNPGVYYLHEKPAEGVEFVELELPDGTKKKFKVTESTLQFTVNDNGSIDTTSETKDTEHGYIEYDTSSKKFIVHDAEYIEPVTATLEISKSAILYRGGQDQNINEIEGAELTISYIPVPGSQPSVDLTEVTATQGGNNISKTAQTVTFTSGTESTILTGLPAGDYTLTENTAPQGYGLAETISFTITETGDITNVTNAKGSFTAAQNNGVPRIIMEDVSNEITLSKMDITGEKEIPGAQLVIRDKDGKEMLTVTGETVWESKGTAGEMAVYALPNGTYTLEELPKEPNGKTFDSDGKSYYIINSVITFTVENGVVTVTTGKEIIKTEKDSSSDTSYVVLDDKHFDICDAEVKNDTPADVIISKYDITNSKELAGAKLTLERDGCDWDSVIAANSDVTFDTVKNSNNAVIGISWKSTENDITIKGLTKGTYTLKESADSENATVFTAENGKKYTVIPSEYQFVVDENGVVTESASVSGFEFSDTNSTYKITVNNAEAIPVEISKKAVNGQTELPGAVLTITNDSITDWSAILANNSDSVKAAKDGNDNVIGITWESTDAPVSIVLPDSAGYILKESGKDGEFIVSGNKRYSVIPSGFGFEIENGNVKDSQPLETVQGTAEVIDAHHILISDAEAFPVVISKKDITGENEVKGASLAILLASDSQTTVIPKWITGAEGEGTEKTVYLPAGDYILREVPADTQTGTFTYTEGNVTKEYKVVSSDVKFSVDENGNVTSADAKTAVNSSATNKDDSYVALTDNKLTVCDAEVKESKLADVTVSKKDINTENPGEIPGATLEIVNKDIDWTDICAKNPDLGFVRDSGNGDKVIGVSWTSGTAPVTVKGLPESDSYTLTERPAEATGTTFTSDDGTTYYVVPSSIRFSIDENGVVTVGDYTESYNEDKGTIKDTSTSADINHITVNDMAVPVAEVEISKMAVNGKGELGGATLKITSTDTVDWAAVIKSDTSNRLSATENKDGVQWTSDEQAAMKIKLPAGSYVLEESGSAFTGSGGKTYTVVKSTFSFEVDADGNVVNAQVVKDTADDANTGSGMVYDADTNKVTVSDAELVGSIAVSKKVMRDDAAGELPGAKLRITVKDKSKTVDWDAVKNSASSQTVTVTDGNDGVQWTSGNDAVTVKLPDGTYVLEEYGDGDTFKVGDDEYYIIPSKFEFTISGGVITSTVQVKELDDDGTKGGFKQTNNTITVSDAEVPAPAEVTISKKVMRDDSADELPGANLRITSKDTTQTVDWEAVKNSASGNTVDITSGNDGVQWISGETAVTVKLPDGTYVLEEYGNGDTVTIDGSEYYIIPSAYEFTVDGGVVTEIKSADSSYDKSKGDMTKEGNTITVSDAEVPAPAEVTVSKKAMRDDAADELPGAKLRITSEDKTIDWNAVKNSASSDTVTVTDKNDGVQWTSGNDAVTVKLPDGTYVLEEYGDGNTFKVGDDEYYIIPSKYEFTISGGSITSTRLISEGGDDGSKGGFTQTNNTITVSDAEVPAPAEVTVSKKAMRDDAADELPGAKLRITSEDKTIDWNAVKNSASSQTVTVTNGNNGVQWTSGNDAVTVKLPDGTYVLEEYGNGDTFKVGDDEYYIIPSKYEFTISGGSITSTRLISVGGDDGSKGGFKQTNNTITVSDAEVPGPMDTIVVISKTAVTGEEELGGATLRLTSSDDIDWVKVADSDTRVKILDNSNGIEWTSGGTPVSLSLPDGEYFLEESGGRFIADDGKAYDVVESTCHFDTFGGKVVKIEYINDDGNAENGSITESDGKITISDAEYIPSAVEIAKTDVNGHELPGAELTLTNDTVDWTEAASLTKGYNTVESEGVMTGMSWISGTDAFVIKGLPDGTGYKLSETGGEFSYNGVNYNVVDSVFTFDIVDGKVVNAVPVENDDRSGISNSGNTITVKDAMKTSGSSEEHDLPNTIYIGKYDISGKTEIAGARLTLVNASIDWTNVIWDAKDAKKVYNDDGKMTGIEWTSIDTDNANFQNLPDSKDYVLYETGGKYFVSPTDGNYYDIIDSQYPFAISGGKVVADNLEDADGGRYENDKDVRIKVCDAAAKNLVILNKTDISGKEELAGAILSVKDKDGNVLTTWTSERGVVYEMLLEDGEYTLVETAPAGQKYFTDTVTGKNYKVLDSEFHFKVDGGKVVPTDSTEANTENGYVSFDGTYTLTVNDVEYSGSEGASGGSGSGESGSGTGGSDAGDGITGDGTGDTGEGTGETGEGTGDTGEGTGDPGGEGGSGDGTGNPGGGEGGSGEGTGNPGGGEGSSGESTGDTGSGEGSGSGEGGSDGSSTGGENPATGAGAGIVTTIALLGLTLVIKKKHENDDQ